MSLRRRFGSSAFADGECPGLFGLRHGFHRHAIESTRLMKWKLTCHSCCRCFWRWLKDK